MEKHYEDLENIFGDLEHEKVSSILRDYEHEAIGDALRVYRKKVHTLKNLNYRGHAPAYFLKVLDSKSEKVASIANSKPGDDGVDWTKRMDWNINSYFILKQKNDGMIEAYIKAYKNKDFPKEVIDHAKSHYHQTGWFIHLNDRLIKKVEDQLIQAKITDFKEYQDLRAKEMEKIDIQKEKDKCRVESIIVILHQYALENNLIKYYAKKYNDKLKEI